MKNKKILHCDYNPDDSKYYCSTKTKYGLLFPEKCELILKYEELYNYIKEHQDDYIYEVSNYKELCEFFKKPLKSMQCSISRFSRGIIDSILSNRDGIKYKVYKIRDEEEL